MAKDVQSLISSIFGPSAPKPKKKLLDLSEPPSADARAGRMSGEAKNYERTWGDTGADVEAILRDIATAQPEALVKAFEEPGIDTATNAAVQTALLAGAPLKAAKAAGAGLVAAGADDLGLFGGEAEADDMDPLGPSRDRFNELQAKQKKGRTLTRAEREEQNTYLKVIQDAQAAKIEADKAKQMAGDKAKQDEFDRSVANAESVRDQELKRVRRFSETEVGKVFDELGGLAPVVGGSGVGALTRAAVGPAAKFSPAIAGATAGITSLNVPLAYNAFMTEPDNPDKAAYSAYARELPPEHPRKGEWEERAKAMPDANPVRTQASEELYDPLKALERAAFGAIEGGLGGQIGKEAVDLLGRGYRGITGQDVPAAGPTMSPPGGPSQMPPAGLGTVPGRNSASYRTYPDLPSGARQAARDSYVADRAVAGSSPPAKATAQAIKNAFAQQGINVPVTPERIKATNAAVQKFVAATGREPSGPADWSQIFNDKTLVAALMTGAGASAMSDPELEALLAEIMGGGG